MKRMMALFGAMIALAAILGFAYAMGSAHACDPASDPYCRDDGDPGRTDPAAGSNTSQSTCDQVAAPGCTP